MNRITKKDMSVGGDEKACCTHFGGLTCYQFTGHCSSGCPYEEQAWEKLAAYEDTGLEPGEIVAVLKGVVPGARIFTLVQDDPQFYPETNGWYVSADTVGAIGIGGFYAGEPAENTFFKYEEIGRGVFLSKEKAEYALEERKNETTDNQ